MDNVWPLSAEETDAILDFAPIASQFFNVDPIRYEDPNEHLAVPGPSKCVNQDGKGVELNVSRLIFFSFLCTNLYLF